MSVPQQCQSSPCYRGGTEGCISAASHRTKDATAVRFTSVVTSNTCRMNLTQADLQCPSLRRADNSGGTPAASSLTNATLEHSERHPCVHTLTHTHTYAHKHRHPSDSLLRKWRMSGSHKHFVSKQSQPDESCIVCMNNNDLKMVY